MAFNNRERFIYGSDTMEARARNDNYNDLNFNNYCCEGDCCYCSTECPYQERH